MVKRTIPVVDLSKFTDGTAAEKKAFVKKLGDAFHEIGFVGVRNHGVSQQLIDDFYAASKAFFGLPTEIKEKYKVSDNGLRAMAKRNNITKTYVERFAYYPKKEIDTLFSL